MSSCVDMAYDKEIDTKVTLAANGITLPIGETEKFTLSELIEDSDDLKTDEDGNYYINESSSTTTEFPSLDAFTINTDNGMSPAINPTYIDIPQELREFIALGHFEIEESITVPLMEHAPIDPRNIEIPKEIQRIDAIYFDTPKRATVRFAAKIFEEIGPADVDLTLQDFHIELPQMLILAPTGHIGDVELIDKNNDGTPLVIDDHDLKIAQITSEEGIFEIHLDIYGLHCGHYTNDGANDFVITPDGEHNLLSVINNEVYLHGDAVVHINLHGPGTILEKQPRLETNFSIEDITIERVSGIVDAGAEESFAITIGDMPDFLDDNDIQLDLYNPYIKLSAVNPMAIPVEASLTIEPQNEAGQPLLDAPIAIENIYISSATYNAENNCMIPCENYLYISMHEPTADWVDASNKTFYLNDTLYTWVKGDLPSLLEKGIPYSLEAHVEASTDTEYTHTVLLNSKSNTLSIDADIIVPLEFGRNFHLSYSDTEGGLDDIFQDISAREAAIIAGYTTTLPLDMQFTLVPMQEISGGTHNIPAEDIVTDNDGKYYRILRNVTVKVLNAEESGVGFIAGTTDTSLNEPTPSTGKIVIKLQEEEKEALKSLTHIEWGIDGDLAKGLEHGILRNTQYLQLKLSAKIAKVEVDLDEL